MTRAIEYSHGKHPNSLANLKKSDGRPRQYKSEKIRRNVSVTPEGWEGIGKLAEQYGCSSKSELLEKLGRGLIKLQISA
ncbi:MAG: hypothetical protein AB4368_16230 [Xenococcaceae cyanobacterium]